AIATIPGVAYGGLTQVEDGGRITATAPSDELVHRCDEKENELREGPCLDALWEQQTNSHHQRHGQRDPLAELRRVRSVPRRGQHDRVPAVRAAEQPGGAEPLRCPRGPVRFGNPADR